MNYLFTSGYNYTDLYANPIRIEATPLSDDEYSKTIHIPELKKDRDISITDVLDEEETVSIVRNEKTCKISCSDKEALSQAQILRCISVMKSELMFKCVPFHVQTIICQMTPTVKDQLISAYRRTEMYGKKLPIIARFDDYGNRLSDEIRIDTLQGMTVQIIDSNTCNTNYYLSFEAIMPKYKKSDSFTFKKDSSVFDDIDKLPF